MTTPLKRGKSIDKKKLYIKPFRIPWDRDSKTASSVHDSLPSGDVHVCPSICTSVRDNNHGQG